MKKIAVIGASNNPEKYGNKIVKDLVSKGFEVIPINQKDEFIEGIKSFKKLNEIKKDFDYVTFVISPEIGLNILKENYNLLKNKKIWFQPGASDNETKAFLENNNFHDYITDSCIMLDTLKN